MSNTRHIYSLFIFIGLILSGCELINPSEEVPSYIYVPDIKLETNVATQGSASAKITEVWVSVGGVFLGAYSLPAVIPILADGMTELTLEAGIKDNGITSRSEIYPFYTPYTIQVDLQPEHMDTIRPGIRYRDDITIAFVEDFEKGKHLFDELLQGNESNRMVIDNMEVFEDNFSGKIYLNKDAPFVELATTESFQNLTDKGFQVYLEMNYRSDTPVVFGIIGKNQNDPDNAFAAYDPGFVPNEDWNKIYFNLSLLVLDNPFDEYQISLQAFLIEQNGNTVLDNATVWLDNIKLIHF